MRIFLTFILVSILFNRAFSTAQYPDYMIYEGDTIAIFSNPLEPYLKSRNIDGFPQFGLMCTSSACWRGYIATWNLKNDSLFLVSIKACVEGCTSEPEIKLDSLFPDKVNNSKVFADWFDGLIVSPQGRRLKYVHMGYESVYEQELHFKISNGILKESKQVSNDIQDPKLIDIYNKELIIDTLFHYISKLDWNELGEERFCDDVYLITINKSGRVSKVKYQNFGESKWEEFWYNQNDLGCRRRIKNSIKHLRFNKYLKGGKPIKYVVRISLDYSEGKIKLTW